jgi:hypothetical protein
MTEIDKPELKTINEKKIVIWMEEYKLRIQEISACINIQQQVINF